MTFLYEISGVRLRLDADCPLAERAGWRLFAAAPEPPPDHTYRISAVPALPEASDSAFVHYFDAVRRRNYAAVRTRGDRTDILLDAATLPHPLYLEHIYPQLALPVILARHGAMLLHAAYILTPRGAVLFTAPSGTGKSTQAELWRQHRDALVVNGDRAALGLRGGVATAYGFPLCGTSDDCLNRCAPVRAVVRLYQASRNEARRLKGAEAVRVLLNGTYLPAEYRSELPHLFDTAVRLAEHIRVFALSCVPDGTAVDALETALRETEGDDRHDADQRPAAQSNGAAFSDRGHV